MWKADSSRYDKMPYRTSGKSGLKLPEIALGVWQNFGDAADPAVMRDTVTTAFDLGVTYFDAADNYGPAPGAAERNLGKILNGELKAYRDEIVVSSKAGYDMWDGPYGNWGSRKHMMSGVDASLKRLGLEYVDIFYHHRPDPQTPLEETMEALCDIVRSGKALYAAVSNYPPALLERAAAYMRARRCPLVSDQVRISLLDRENVESGLPDLAVQEGVGLTVYSALAQGLLTDAAAAGKTDGKRVGRVSRLSDRFKDSATAAAVAQYAAEAAAAGLTLAQYAIRYALRVPAVSTVIIGASSAEQVQENVAAVRR